jgi:uncharacterized heparinase superfamily protein
MVSETIGSQARDRLAAVGAVGRKAMRSILTSSLSRALMGAPTAHQLLLIPQDLRTADPSFASELYDGYFGLAGSVALTGSESPFTVQPPSVLWQRELYAFNWLQNLEAAGDQMARDKACDIVSDWASFARHAPPVAWEIDIVARRVISLLSHAGFLLEGAQRPFYDQTMRMLSSELQYLTLSYTDPGNVTGRLRALSALLLGGLCIAEHRNYVTTYLPVFSAELERQILPDGGHISRNPTLLIELLLEFLPLKQCFLSRSRESPEVLDSAINRMMGMIRFLRLGDGSIARFNGMGATRSDLAAAVLAYADDDSMPHLHAPDSGYCRMVRGTTTLIADAGNPPPGFASAGSHAGYLSFEMTSGIEPMIVNCGAPRDEMTEWGIACRSTAAHSTLTINEMSSSKLIKRRIGYPHRPLHLLGGPKMVRGEVKPDQHDFLFRGMHDGYRERFGLIHQRRIRLAGNGRSVEGVDQLGLAPDAKSLVKPGDNFAIRFHLHPRVSPLLDAEENSVGLTLPDAQLWKFRAAGAKVDIEETVFLADPIIQKRSLQIVLRGTCATDVQVVWSIRKLETNVRDPSRSGYRGNREIEKKG